MTRGAGAARAGAWRESLRGSPVERVARQPFIADQREPWSRSGGWRDGADRLPASRAPRRTRDCDQRAERASEDGCAHSAVLARSGSKGRGSASESGARMVLEESGGREAGTARAPLQRRPRRPYCLGGERPRFAVSAGGWQCHGAASSAGAPQSERVGDTAAGPRAAQAWRGGWRQRQQRAAPHRQGRGPSRGPEVSKDTSEGWSEGHKGCNNSICFPL